jgi:hypothetical protein
MRVSTTIRGGSKIPHAATPRGIEGVSGVMSNAERWPTDEPTRAGLLRNGVGVVSNDAAANHGPPKLPALPTVTNNNCDKLEGVLVLGTEVNAVEDGGVLWRASPRRWTADSRGHSRAWTP